MGHEWCRALYGDLASAVLGTVCAETVVITGVRVDLAKTPF